jgi:hypothetical protein
MNSANCEVWWRRNNGLGLFDEQVTTFLKIHYVTKNKQQSLTPELFEMINCLEPWKQNNSGTNATLAFNKMAS